MSTAEKQLSVVQGGVMPTLHVSNDDKLVAIRETVAKGANDAEFTMLMHLANTYKLDPFLKEIWFIKYGQTPTIMVSRDGLRNYAMRQDDFLGMMSQEVREGDTFKFNPITGEIHHEIGDGSGPITKCYCMLKRHGKPDHIEIIDFKEYFDALSKKNPVWVSHPSAMGKKTVEVLALKKCYTITGLYAPEEMGMQEPTDIPGSFVPEYTMGGTVDDHPSKSHPTQPQRREQVGGTPQERVKAMEELLSYAEPIGIVGDELRAIGAQLTGKPDPKKWTMADILSIRAEVERRAAAQFAQEEVSQGEQVSLPLDDLPNDDDLPF